MKILGILEGRGRGAEDYRVHRGHESCSTIPNTEAKTHPKGLTQILLPLFSEATRTAKP